MPFIKFSITSWIIILLGMIRRTISYKEPKIMLSLYKTLVRPHVEYCSCACNPYYRKDKELLLLLLILGLVKCRK